VSCEAWPEEFGGVAGCFELVFISLSPGLLTSPDLLAGGAGNQ
jgi:hypothetical protein